MRLFRHAPSTNSGTVESLLDIGRQLVPKNIVMAAATAQYLGVIAFAIVFAIILTALGPPAEPLIRIIEIANDAIMAMVGILILYLFCSLQPHCSPLQAKCTYLSHASRQTGFQDPASRSTWHTVAAKLAQATCTLAVHWCSNPFCRLWYMHEQAALCVAQLWYLQQYKACEGSVTCHVVLCWGSRQHTKQGK